MKRRHTTDQCQGWDSTPGYSYVNSRPLSRVHLNLCTESLPLGAVGYAQDPVISSAECWLLGPQDMLFGLLCSLISAAWWVLIPTGCTVEFTSMPFQAQLVLGVQDGLLQGQGRCSPLWTLGKMGLRVLQLSYIPKFSMENKIKASPWGNVYFSATTLLAPPQIWQQFNIRKDFRPSHPFSENKRPQLKQSTKLRSLGRHHSILICAMPGHVSHRSLPAPARGSVPAAPARRSPSTAASDVGGNKPQKELCDEEIYAQWYWSGSWRSFTKLSRLAKVINSSGSSQ